MATPYPSQPNQPMAPQNGMGTAALVMGIVQWFCLGIVGSILAVVFGRIGMKRAEQGLATNGGAAKAGYILGIIGIILNIIAFIVLIVVFATSGGSMSTT